MRRSLASVVLSSLLVACGARTTALSEADFEPSSVVDSGGVDSSIDSARTDTFVADSRPPVPDSGPRVDTGIPVDVGPPSGNTVGDPCTTDSDCDKTGDGTHRCSVSTFSEGSLYPNPVCLAVECDPGDGTTIARCDGDRGICLDGGGGSGICLAICSFDESGAAPRGCATRDACNYFTIDHASDGTAVGYGYCFGGCFTDADCTGGDRCQKENGLCERRVTTYPKKVGEACTSADVMTIPAACNCLYTSATNVGYCSSFCELGAPGCPAGYTCDAFLPKVDPFTGGPAFTTAPKSLAGYCMKDCAADADCAPLNGYCEENGGTGRKTCQPGRRP